MAEMFFILSIVPPFPGRSISPNSRTIFGDFPWIETLKAENAAGSLRGVIEKKYNIHETRETFFYHWCEDQNLGNPLFNQQILYGYIKKGNKLK